MAIEIPATAAEREEFLFNYNQRKQTNREMIPLEEVSEKETRLRELPRGVSPRERRPPTPLPPHFSSTRK